MDEHKRRAGNTSISTLVQGNSRFALSLYYQLRSAEGNLFVSPYSISTALAITYAGARGNTASQMWQTLRFGLEDDQLHPVFARLGEILAEVEREGGVELKIANALWLHQEHALMKEYLDLVEQFYGAPITALDYDDPESARDRINTWIAGITEQKVKELIPPGMLNALTRLVLTNAIYFRGDWASQFDTRRTVEMPFWVGSNQAIPASMMSQQGYFDYAEVTGTQILELPYAGDELSMVIALPSDKSGLEKLEQSLSQENLANWLPLLRNREVQVFLPGFKLSCTYNLNQTLQSMGMVDAFSGTLADFSGMDGSRLLRISEVLHKAYIEVNEEGTEAAAATAVLMSLGSTPEPPVVFRADHPFVFFILDKRTGSILFIGRVIHPGNSD